MTTVREIVAKKGPDVFTCSPSATVFEAAVLMNEHRIGAVVVIEAGRLAGMFTERDILQRVVAQQRDANNTQVADVMTTEVACCRMHTTIEEARGVMKNRRIRHLPVIDQDDGLVALVSIGDLNAYEASSQEMTIHLLHQYIYGQG
jgi:CBS domain-containing protein